MANDKILATFRIEPEKWEAFKALATSSGRSASAFLLDFIDGCLDANQISSLHSDTNKEMSVTNLDTSGVERLDSIEHRLDNLDKLSDERIDASLEAHLDRIEHRLDDRHKLLEERIDELRIQMQEQLDSLRGKLKARLVR